MEKSVRILGQTFKEANSIKTPILRFRVGEMSVPALLDTGASCSVISTDTLRNIGRWPDRQPISMRVHGAGGTCTANYRVRMIIRIGGKRLRHRFIVMDKLQVPAILGRDFLSKTKFILDIAGGGWRSRK